MMLSWLVFTTTGQRDCFQPFIITENSALQIRLHPSTNLNGKTSTKHSRKLYFIRGFPSIIKTQSLTTVNDRFTITNLRCGIKVPRNQLMLNENITCGKYPAKKYT